MNANGWNKSCRNQYVELVISFLYLVVILTLKHFFFQISMIDNELNELIRKLILLSLKEFTI